MSQILQTIVAGYGRGSFVMIFTTVKSGSVYILEYISLPFEYFVIYLRKIGEDVTHIATSQCTKLLE